MAFTPDFKYDIFISYAHDDNTAPKDKDGWVDRFHAELEAWLARRFGRNQLQIWRDQQEIRGNTVFDERIQQAINESALFLALLSPNYQHSEYCQKELDWFYQHARTSQVGLTVAGESRLFNLLLRNIPPTEWPKELSGTSGFPLHDAPSTSTELFDATDPNRPEFQSQLRQIVDAIDKTLRLFPRPKTEPAPPEVEKRIKLFLADVPDTLDEVREQLADDLKASSVEILNYIPPPMTYTDHENRLRETVQTADLTVNLLDELPGRKIIDHKTSTYPWQQTEIALELETPQLICLPRNLSFQNINNQSYANFLSGLADNPDQEKKYEFIRFNSTELTQIVLDKINQLKQAVKPTNGKPTILLDTSYKDQLCAFELAQYLIHHGLKIELTQESFDPDLCLSQFETAIKNVHNLIIIFGKVNQDWVIKRVWKMLQIVATREYKARLKNCWIYMIPPKKKPEIFKELPPPLVKINFLDNCHSDQIDPKVVKSLLDCCQERGRV